MKFLIWLGCVTAYSVIVVSSRYAGIHLGGIPVAIIFLVFVFVLPKVFFKKYDEYKEAKENLKVSESNVARVESKVSELNIIKEEVDASKPSVATEKNVDITVNSQQKTHTAVKYKEIKAHVKPKSKTPNPKRRVTVVLLIILCVVLFIGCVLMCYCFYVKHQESKLLESYINTLEKENTKLESEIQKIENATAAESTVDPKHAHKEGFVFGYKKGYIEAYEAAMKEAGAIYKDTGYEKFSERLKAIERAEVNAEHYAKQRFEDFLNFFQYHGLQ